MTQEELNRQMAALAEELHRLGVPVSRHILPQVKINTRARRRLGSCAFDAVTGNYTIEISAPILEDPAKLRETLLHELLHTCRGCRDHGERWKAYAAEVNRALGTSIQRLAPGEGEPVRLRHDTVKYVLECESCGARITRTRMCKVVKTPWRYRCLCGGRLRRVPLESK